MKHLLENVLFGFAFAMAAQGSAEAQGSMPASMRASSRPTDVMERCEFNSSKSGISMKYLLFQPNADKSGKALPLVVYLHGKGRRGEELSRIRVPPALLSDEVQKSFPCFVIAPLCSADRKWVDYPDADKSEYQIANMPKQDTFAVIMEIVEQICAEHPVDRDRIYLTGYSMGGFGAWYGAIEYGNIFAAVAPISGSGDPTRGDGLVNMPLWAFHGEADATVPVEGSRKMIEAIKKSGGNPRYTEYEGVGHNAGLLPYRDELPKDGKPDLIEWMFSQRKNRLVGPTASTPASETRSSVVD